MISRPLRSWCGEILVHLAGLIGAAGVTSAMLSSGGLLKAMIAGLAFARSRMIAAAVLICVSGGLDGIDCEVAAVTSTASALGGFIDSVCDHVGDFAIYLGLAWHAAAIQASGQLLLLLATGFGSLFGSLIRARATSLGADLKDVGLITRCERMLILLIGAVVNHIGPALWVLAVLTNISAVQRLVWVLSSPPGLEARRLHRTVENN